MLSIKQFRSEIIEPTLIFLGPEFATEAATRLLLGTAVQESGLRFLRQHNDGPARGVYQIEPRTADDVFNSYLRFRPALEAKVKGLMAVWPDMHQQLASNLIFATAMARLVYWRDPEPLPDADDIEGLARMWKRVFNTAEGHGSVAAYVLHFREFVEPILT